MARSNRQPCPTCPWRLDQDASVIPNFVLSLAEGLADTSPDERGYGPNWGATWFACHQSRPAAEIVCAGWLAVHGSAHPGVRLAVARGALSVDTLSPGDDWPPLEESYQSMMTKLRRTCQPDD